MKRKNFIIVDPSTEWFFKAYEDKVNAFIEQFKNYYSRFDKRLLTTKKKVYVNWGNPFLNISIDFNGKNYGQCYHFFGGIDIVYPN